MSLLDIAYVPPVAVPPSDTVRSAVAMAEPSGCDAVAVVEQDRLVGILTSRDVLLKIVIPRRDSGSVLVREVMTSPVITLKPDTDPETALQTFLDHNFRHLPISIDGEKLEGMLSLRKLLKFIVQDQQENLLHLETFINVDGIGG